MTLRTLNYGNYGIFLTLGNAGFCPSAVYNLLFVVGLVAAGMHSIMLEGFGKFVSLLYEGYKRSSPN